MVVVFTQGFWAGKPAAKIRDLESAPGLFIDYFLVNSPKVA
jgi:hypothetical protein